MPNPVSQQVIQHERISIECHTYCNTDCFWSMSNYFQEGRWVYRYIKHIFRQKHGIKRPRYRFMLNHPNAFLVSSSACTKYIYQVHVCSINYVAYIMLHKNTGINQIFHLNGPFMTPLLSQQSATHSSKTIPTSKFGVLTVENEYHSLQFHCSSQSDHQVQFKVRILDWPSTHINLFYLRVSVFL